LKVIRGSLRGYDKPATEGGGASTHHTWAKGEVVEIIEVRHSEAWSCALTAGAGGWVAFWQKYDDFPGKGFGGMTFADQAPSTAKAIANRFEVFTVQS
jgi:hypothetical protein